MSALPQIRIGIADDHPVVRLGLRACLAGEPDFTVVAEAGNGREALDRVREGGLDVLLLDVAMPVLSGVDALAAIRARAPALPVLMFSGAPARHYAVALMRQGASGYLHKGCAPHEIVAAIRAVCRGRHYLSEDTAEALADALDRDRLHPGLDTDRPRHEHLSRRELQVFLHLAQGETVGHMAQSLSLSVKTVSTYRTRVMEKMALASNSDLTYYALKSGLLQ